MKNTASGFTIALASLLICGCGGKAASNGPLFESPSAAVVAFAEAVRVGNREALTTMLGPEAAELVNADTVQGGNERKVFIGEYDSQRLLVAKGPDAYVLEVGPRRWPLPLPIVKSGDAWKFDASSGIRELVLRRVGRNELLVLDVCRGIVAAQKEYAAKFGGFASKLRSEPGKQDGLYWETQPGEPQSPAGAMLAQAERLGYAPGGPEPQPYRGYIYRRLEVKDPAKEFAILAYPAQHGSSGIMTFIVNQDGAIYRKDLGADTATAVAGITGFTPDDTWTRES